MMQTLNLVDGVWIPAQTGETFDVLDPATDEVVARVPNGGRADAVAAIEAAARAQPRWRSTTADHRAAILWRLAASMRTQTDRLARLMTREQGKPLAEARGEIAYAASFFEWAAEEGKRLHGEVIPAPTSDKRIMVLRQPVGVTAAITPWNFPAAMITRKLGPALAAGCTMVVKPAEQTPLSALALAELAVDAGVPPGVLNVVTGDPEAIGAAFLEHPAVRVLSFTGSTEVGQHLVARSAQTLTRLSLELGGHAPFIVFDDADLDAAVAGAIASKFRNAGQTCISPNRFLVHHAVHDEFCARMLEACAMLRSGPGCEEGVTTGPLIDDAAVAKVKAHVDDAVARGAVLRCGGEAVRPAAGLTPRFFAPTLLEGVDGSMRLSHEETFGPVVGVREFSDEAEAVAIANDTPYGLAAYFYTRDHARVWRVAEALEYGIVGVNDGAPSTARAPFGGMKHSGMGREGGRWVMDEYTEIKYVSWGLG
ncbi:MAG: NAD-dependent succinate-semialdehyde dehydrogenase [Deltaproteobacteria bacterium]|nr:NAD-dependent succinate-semialdehyde dehydrogenase [Deltaproteobacteria bacterium]